MLYPPVCPICQKIVKKSERGGICHLCQKKIAYIKEPYCMKCGKSLKEETQEYCKDCARISYAFDEGRAVFLHQGEVASSIYRMKFHNKRSYAQVFAGEMAVQFGEWIKRRDIQEIIPVPLHQKRRRRRGYNQAELLAVELGRRTGIPVNSDAVVRVRNTRPQKLLDNRQRIANLNGAFGVRRQWEVKRNVLVVDDIYTTGNTIHEIARLLKRVGTHKVYFLSISIGQGL